MKKLKPGELVQMVRDRTERAWAEMRERERAWIEGPVRITGGDQIVRKIPLWEVPFTLRHPRWRWLLGLTIALGSVAVFVAGFLLARAM